MDDASNLRNAGAAGPDSLFTEETVWSIFFLTQTKPQAMFGHAVERLPVRCLVVCRFPSPPPSTTANQPILYGRLYIYSQ